MEGREKNGRFIKGTRVTGRQKGTPDKVDAEQKRRISAFFDAHWDEFEKDIWPALTAKEKKDTFIALINYEYPKLTSVDVKTFNKVESSVLDEIRKKIKDCSII